MWSAKLRRPLSDLELPSEPVDRNTCESKRNRYGDKEDVGHSFYGSDDFVERRAMKKLPYRNYDNKSQTMKAKH